MLCSGPIIVLSHRPSQWYPVEAINDQTRRGLREIHMQIITMPRGDPFAAILPWGTGPSFQRPELRATPYSA